MIRYAILGLIQGLTEFLPVSSSGHLVLAGTWLRIESPGVLLEACLHLGTLAAVLWVFRKDVFSWMVAFTPRGCIERRKEVGLIIAATIPIVIAGFFFRRYVDAAFGSLKLVGGALLVTGVVLLAAWRFRSRAFRRELRFPDAMVVGLAQVLALLPGISRAGITIGAAVGRRIATERAARFSFLLAIPTLLGAGVLNLLDAVLDGGWSGDWAGVGLGTAVAFVVGILAIHALFAVLRRSRMWVFAAYCFGVGAAALVLGLAT
ncbi:undecaprenyl-diphosphate phosphatase [Candidatus Bipolaricaulota bacterium]|nr:undecaprenyl-diphosphate phosphatase [Candidatus Bipolaricaulota bacterium]